MPGGGARGQNLEHLRFFFFCFFFLVLNYLYLNNSYYLGLTPSVTSNIRFIVLGWGKHNALITSVDKPSQP